MEDAEAIEHAWRQVKLSLRPYDWMAAEEAMFFGFFCHGWRAAGTWGRHMASECQRMADEIDRLRNASSDLVTCIIHGEAETGLKHNECLGKLYGMSVLEPATNSPNAPDEKTPLTPAKDTP